MTLALDQPAAPARKPRPVRIIEVRDLSVGFGERIINSNLSLDVYRGEILGVVGASGTGKSVLMRTIIGLVEKREGTIRVFGQDTDELNATERRAMERRWGVLFQHGALFSSLTVRQNIQIPMREHLSLSARLLDELALLKLELVGLPLDAADKHPSELSGGMVKRAALARALALDPELVFLDEPTSGLDPIGAGAFDELIATLQQTLGLTVFMVTHDLDSLVNVCDRVAALGEGHVLATGSVDALRAHEHPWLRSYFHGRGRGGRSAAARDRKAELRGEPGALRSYRIVHAGGGRCGVRLRLVVQPVAKLGTAYDRAADLHRLGLRLSRGSVVRFNGLRVGEVTEIALLPDDPGRVQALIEIDPLTPLKTDTRARLEYSGLTGVATVNSPAGRARRKP